MTKLSVAAGLVLPALTRLSRSIAAEATQTQTSPSCAAEVLASVHCSGFRAACAGAEATWGAAGFFAPGNRGFACDAAVDADSVGSCSSVSTGTSFRCFPHGNGITCGIRVGACGDNGALSA